MDDVDRAFWVDMLDPRCELVGFVGEVFICFDAFNRYSKGI